MPERPRLIDHVDPAMRSEVAAKFPSDYLEWYESLMHNILRLQHVSYLPIRAGFQESNLDHTCAMLDMLQELKVRFKHLPGEIDFRQVAYMIGLHDSGEIIVGDAPAFGELRESEEWQRRKKLEPKAAQRFILDKIPDEVVRTEMSSLHHRFTNQDPNDREALLTRFLDRAQGSSRTGVTFAFDYKAAGLAEPDASLIKHVLESTEKLYGAALNLHDALPIQAGAELKQYTIEEFQRFAGIGFSWIATRKIDQFDRATSIPASRLSLVG